LARASSRNFTIGVREVMSSSSDSHFSGVMPLADDRNRGERCASSSAIVRVEGRASPSATGANDEPINVVVESAAEEVGTSARRLAPPALLK
jgi:hypothetical protein